MKTEIIFGFHAVQVILKSQSERITELWVQQGRQDNRLNKVLSAAERQGITVLKHDKKTLDKKVDGNHQGVIALCRPGKAHDENFLYQLLDELDATPFLLILDGVTDPHNLGAVLRSADAAGVHAVIGPKDNSASLNATARKVACGAADVVPFIPVTNLGRTMSKLQERGIWIAGAAGEADKLVYEQDLKGPLAIAMGAEGTGLRRLTREHCDYLIKIPMAGEVSSLNVSVATGVCLFEAVRQRV
ncbi:MAG: 23S rRNA (guanosine(2251)-2'-O)-methyltransferase RlmB [Cellvibrionaceae bacterium]